MVSKSDKALSILKQGLEGLGKYLSQLQGKPKCNIYEIEKAREGLIRGDALIGVLSQSLPELALKEVRQIQDGNWGSYSKLQCEE